MPDCISSDTVLNYRVLTENKTTKVTAAVGNYMGGISMFDGVGTSFETDLDNIATYTIFVEFKSGEKSLIQINQNYFEVFAKSI